MTQSDGGDYLRQHERSGDEAQRRQSSATDQREKASGETSAGEQKKAG